MMTALLVVLSQVPFPSAGPMSFDGGGMAYFSRLAPDMAATPTATGWTVLISDDRLRRPQPTVWAIEVPASGAGAPSYRWLGTGGVPRVAFDGVSTQLATFRTFDGGALFSLKSGGSEWSDPRMTPNGQILALAGNDAGFKLMGRLTSTLVYPDGGNAQATPGAWNESVQLVSGPMGFQAVWLAGGGVVGNPPVVVRSAEAVLLSPTEPMIGIQTGNTVEWNRSSPGVASTVVSSGGGTHFAAGIAGQTIGAWGTQLYVASDAGVLELTQMDPLALAGGPTSGLLVGRVGTTLQFRRIPLQAAGTNSTTLDVPAMQRAPSVLWVPSPGVFLVMWEQWNGQLFQQAHVLISSSGAVLGGRQGSPGNQEQPRLVRGVNGSFGVSSTTSSGLTVFDSQLMGDELNTSTALAFGGMEHARVGALQTLMWGASQVRVGALTIVPPAAVTPRCAAVFDGSFWLAWSVSGVTSPRIRRAELRETASASNVTTVSLEPPSATASICLMETRERVLGVYQAESSELIVAEVHPTPRVLYRFQGRATHPVLATDGNDFVVGWLEQAKVFGYTPSRGRFEVAEDVHADNLDLELHENVAVFVWDTVAKRLGASRTQLRLITFDGGLAPDAGQPDASVMEPPDASVGDASVGDASVADASVADASVADASVADASVGDASVADASVGDASVADASAGDASVADAGTNGSQDFTTTCGCSGGPGVAALWVLALLARRRWVTRSSP